MARGIYIGPISDLIHRQAYVAAYDRRLRHPAWVCVLFFSSLFLFFTILYQTAEHLSLTSLGKSRVTPREEEGPAGDRANSTFKEDESLPLMFRSKLSDYFKSGYDRGHMWVSMWSTELFVLTMCRVPAADAKISQVWFLKDPCQTFTLVNRKLLTRRSICPTSLLKLEMGSIDIVSVCVCMRVLTTWYSSQTGLTSKIGVVVWLASSRMYMSLLYLCIFLKGILMVNGVWYVPCRTSALARRRWSLLLSYLLDAWSDRQPT